MALGDRISCAVCGGNYLSPKKVDSVNVLGIPYWHCLKCDRGFYAGNTQRIVTRNIGHRMGLTCIEFDAFVGEVYTNTN